MINNRKITIKKVENAKENTISEEVKLKEEELKKQEEFREKSKQDYEVEKKSAHSFFMKGDYNNAQAHYYKALVIAQNANLIVHQAIARGYYGFCLVRLGKLEDGLKEQQKAFELFPKAERENSLDFAMQRYHLGLIFEQKQIYMQAFTEFSESYRLIDQRHKPEEKETENYYKAVCYQLAGMGRICKQLNSKEAKFYLEQAFLFFTKLKMSDQAQKIQDLLAQCISPMMKYVISSEGKVTVVPSIELKSSGKEALGRSGTFAASSQVLLPQSSDKPNGHAVPGIKLSKQQENN